MVWRHTTASRLLLWIQRCWATSRCGNSGCWLSITNEARGGGGGGGGILLPAVTWSSLDVVSSSLKVASSAGPLLSQYDRWTSATCIIHTHTRRLLRCVTSYLSGHIQSVRCGMSTSDASAVLCGVPQGSVLGTILFLLYTADLLWLVECHNLRPHVYADDIQIYGFSRPTAATPIQTWLLLEPKFASAHKILLKPDDSRLRYSEIIFKMAAVRHLKFSKFGILVTWLVSEHYYASSYRISR